MLDDTKLESFVGKKTSYYLENWRGLHDKSRSIASFNIAACFGQMFWLAYRKLYVPLFWVAVVAVTEVSLTLYAENNQLVPAELIASWDWLAVFLYLAVIGTFGNYWY